MDIKDALLLEQPGFDPKTPKRGFTQMTPMSVEDQHEWLEARRVSLMTQLELTLALTDAVPDWLLAEWLRLQHARDRLLHHRICQDNWSLFVVELRRVRQRLSSLLRWPVCDSWDTTQLRQLSADWLLVCRRLQTSGYHLHHTLPVGLSPGERACSPGKLRSPGAFGSPYQFSSPSQFRSPGKFRSPGRAQPQQARSPHQVESPCPTGSPRQVRSPLQVRSSHQVRSQRTATFGSGALPFSGSPLPARGRWKGVSPGYLTP